MGSGSSKPNGKKYKIRLTRPLALGTGNDMHHLHINQIAAFNSAGEKLPLALSATPTNPLGAHPGCHPSTTLDAGGRMYHSNFDDRGRTYGKEDLWLEYTLDASAGELGMVKVWNRNDNACSRRIVGSILTVHWQGEGEDEGEAEDEGDEPSSQSELKGEELEHEPVACFEFEEDKPVYEFRLAAGGAPISSDD